MAARLLVVDSGGTTRQLSRLIVTDSGGVERAIQRLFVVDSGGTARLVFGAVFHDTTIDVASQGGSTYGYAIDGSGSLGSDNYTDGTPTTRYIQFCTWNTATDGVSFVLQGGLIPDTDTVFRGIEINGVQFLRSARATYNNVAGGGTLTEWAWSSGASLLPTSGTYSFKVLR